MKLGEKLYKLRESKNMSQEELAERLDVSRQTISNWENDKVTLDVDKAQELCKLYGIDMNALFDFPSSNEKPQRKRKGVVAALIVFAVAAIILIMFSGVMLAFTNNDVTSSTITLGANALWIGLIALSAAGLIAIAVILVKILKSK